MATEHPSPDFKFMHTHTHTQPPHGSPQRATLAMFWHKKPPVASRSTRVHTHGGQGAAGGGGRARAPELTKRGRAEVP